MIILTPVSPLLLPYFSPTLTHSSVTLFPLALSCRTLNVLSSLICSVGGAGDLVGGGDCWDGGAEQASQVNHLFSDTGLHLRFQNILRTLIQSIWCTCS